MRLSFIGGMRDGQSFDVSQPLPPVLHMAEPVEDLATAWWTEDALTVSKLGFVAVSYWLAYTVLDHRPYYVEERVLERWSSINYELLTGT